MKYDEAIKYLINDCINYFANKYVDLEGNTVQGKNKLNEKLVNYDYLQMPSFILGKYENMTTSFLFVGIANVNSVGGGYIGDPLGYQDTVNMVIRVYKQVKPPDIFVTYNVLPLAVEQVAREWFANINENGMLSGVSPQFSRSEPQLDSQGNSVNNFSAVQGLYFEIAMSFNIFTNSEELNNN